MIFKSESALQAAEKVSRRMVWVVRAFSPASQLFIFVVESASADGHASGKSFSAACLADGTSTRDHEFPGAYRIAALSRRIIYKRFP